MRGGLHLPRRSLQWKLRARCPDGYVRSHLRGIRLRIQSAILINRHRVSTRTQKYSRIRAVHYGLGKPGRGVPLRVICSSTEEPGISLHRCNQVNLSIRDVEHRRGYAVDRDLHSRQRRRQETSRIECPRCRRSRANMQTVKGDEFGRGKASGQRPSSGVGDAENPWSRGLAGRRAG